MAKIKLSSQGTTSCRLRWVHLLPHLEINEGAEPPQSSPFPDWSEAALKYAAQCCELNNKKADT